MGSGVSSANTSCHGAPSSSLITCGWGAQAGGRTGVHDDVHRRCTVRWGERNLYLFHAVGVPGAENWCAHTHLHEAPQQELWLHHPRSPAPSPPASHTCMASLLSKEGTLSHSFCSSFMAAGDSRSGRMDSAWRGPGMKGV